MLSSLGYWRAGQCGCNGHLFGGFVFYFVDPFPVQRLKHEHGEFPAFVEYAIGDFWTYRVGLLGPGEFFDAELLHLIFSAQCTIISATGIVDIIRLFSDGRWFWILLIE